MFALTQGLVNNGVIFRIFENMDLKYNRKLQKFRIWINML